MDELDAGSQTFLQKRIARAAESVAEAYGEADEAPSICLPGETDCDPTARLVAGLKGSDEANKLDRLVKTLPKS